MGDKTGISWTNSSWNPIRGCSVVSSGCKNCYAMSVAYRFSGPGQPYEGLAVLKNGHASWTGKVDFVEEHLLDPIRWKKPRKIFVNSMSDLFHENVTDEMRDKIFAVMALASNHQFQILTKRPERMKAYLDMVSEEKDMQRWINAAYDIVPDLSPCWAGAAENLEWPLPNVWLGVSTEDQETANKRIPLLLQTPAAVRFISAEPLLGEIDLRSYLPRRLALDELPGNAMNDGCSEGWTEGLNWVIIGGESGPNARPCHLAWCSRLIVQCKMAKVAVFMKQMGGNISDEDLDYIQRATGKSVHDRKGGNMDEFPLQLRVQEYPA